MSSSSELNVLMVGWELPPFNSGGLGVACLGLAKALTEEGVGITFLLPRKMDISYDFMKIVFASDSTEFSYFSSPMLSYTTPELYKAINPHDVKQSRFHSLLEEVQFYALLSQAIAKREKFDLVHAHDWLTFLAGITAQRISDKPLVAQLHATEFDRTGNTHVNQQVYDIERKGIHHADKVIAVSNLTKNIITSQYATDSSHVDVVHNGVDAVDDDIGDELVKLKKRNHIVLFVGRFTLQKGPDYFLKVAKKILEYEPHVIFVMVGAGDMKEQLIKEVASLGISDKVIFTGFLRDEKLRHIYKSADVFVMPSVSEPFGITGLESAINGTPVLVSKQSGVSEVLTHALKVDFWDIDEMVNKILAVIRHRSLHKTLRENGKKQAHTVSWKKAAQKVKHIYKEVLAKRKKK